MKHTDPLIQKTIEMAKINLKEQDELLPTFFLGAEDKVAIVAAPWKNDRDKDMAAQVIKRMARSAAAEFVLFVSEIYTIKDQDAAREFMHNRDKYPDVKSHPKAVECVLFMLETHTGTWQGIADILPEREMGEVEWTKSDSVEGRFANFLGPKPAVH